MKQVMVRYRVRPDQVETNEALVRDVYEELRRARPDGLRYVTFKLDDGVSFMHLASVETADGESPLSRLPAFARFLEGIAERCDDQPRVTELDLVGDFRVFDPLPEPAA